MIDTLDLHGIKHSDVPTAVIHFIEDHWLDDEDTEIIIGHSTPMFNIVTCILADYKFGFVTNLDRTKLLITK